VIAAALIAVPAFAAFVAIDGPATVTETADRITTTTAPGATTTTSVPAPGPIYSSNFTGANGAAWPAPWTPLNSAVISATINSNTARLRGDTTRVARMALPIEHLVDADVTFTVQFDNYSSQGFGFYVRQNGGALRDTTLHGQGYAIFVEGGYQRVVGIWKEIDGIETRIAASPVDSALLTNGVRYRVRYLVVQEGEVTRLRGKFWPEGTAEPSSWAVDVLDSTPQLQNTAGAFAADVYNYAGTDGVNLDDLAISRP
jgi:hypothetical protein